MMYIIASLTAIGGIEVGPAGYIVAFGGGSLLILKNK